MFKVSKTLRNRKLARVLVIATVFQLPVFRVGLYLFYYRVVHYVTEETTGRPYVTVKLYQMR